MATMIDDKPRPPADIPSLQERPVRPAAESSQAPKYGTGNAYSMGPLLARADGKPPDEKPPAFDVSVVVDQFVNADAESAGALAKLLLKLGQADHVDQDLKSNSIKCLEGVEMLSNCSLSQRRIDAVAQAILESASELKIARDLVLKAATNTMGYESVRLGVEYFLGVGDYAAIMNIASNSRIDALTWQRENMRENRIRTSDHFWNSFDQRLDERANTIAHVILYFSQEGENVVRNPLLMNAFFITDSPSRRIEILKFLELRGAWSEIGEIAGKIDPQARSRFMSELIKRIESSASK